MQRAALGCKIDGGQYKMGTYTHEDAEVIAATVAGMPDTLGGKRMAIRVAELARAGLTGLDARSCAALRAGRNEAQPAWGSCNDRGGRCRARAVAREVADRGGAGLSGDVSAGCPAD